QGRGERTEQAKKREPPDVPDQREAGDDGKEGSDEADRRIRRHLERPILRLEYGLNAVLGLPEGVFGGNERQYGEVPGRRRRRRRPFQRTAVPGITRRVA